ncbi:MAG: dienelactone hydrolase [Actinobacteria bacterium]|nr:dienelactone hydrolase [Actinomycetota bacterium]
MATVQPLEGFEAQEFEHDGIRRQVFHGGTGPAVIVIHEVPGITPLVAAFARRVIDQGYSVRMPSLFGTPGKAMSVPYVIKSLTGACVAREFNALALDRTPVITGWLRALAAEAHEECGGPGVGAIGMCFTGGFALGMMVDERMLAPVLSQPSVPFPLGKKRKAAVGISDEDFERVKARARQGGCVLGMRFTNDPAVAPERFETLRRELGNAFIGIEIDSSKGNPHGISRMAHSVVTEHFVDEAEHPTFVAMERVLSFFDERLKN